MRFLFHAIAAAAALMLTGCVTTDTAAPRVEAQRILIFSHSTGYRHDSIEPAVAALRTLAEREGYLSVASEDPDVFSAEGLEGFDAIVLVSNTTSPRDPNSEWFVGARRVALQNFVRGGGGVVGIHAAADSHRNWPWYRQMIGGVFRMHPPGTPSGTVTVVDGDHPATRNLPQTIQRTDEWYYYDDFNPDVRLLVTYDRASIGQSDAGPNPISWSHQFEGGRVFYTGLGHTPESYAEPLFIEHLRGGLRWALQLED
jgi:type 1 glutamine amidotransferase